MNVLREYLGLELRVDTPFPFDPERAFDDFGDPPYLRMLVTCGCCASLCAGSVSQLVLCMASWRALQHLWSLWLPQQVLHASQSPTRLAELHAARGLPAGRAICVAAHAQP